MRIPFRIVDVFTDRPLAGNQLCVVPDPVDLSAEPMQALAREIGFSETTFVTDVGGDRYAMRIFTPSSELPFAGHPSLGTAYVLVSEGRVRTPVTQVVGAGEFRLDVDTARGFATMRQLEPVFGPRVEDAAATAAAAGLTPDDLRRDVPAELVSTGLPHLMVLARDATVVARARPHPERLVEVLGSVEADGYYLFALDGDRAKARLFATGIGIEEDPATGSAAGPLGAFVVEHGLCAPGRLTISQGEEVGRPSTLLVDVVREGGSWGVSVGGGVVRVAEGVFELFL